MSDVLTMIRKEFLEIRFSLKYLIGLVGVCGLPLLVLYDRSRSLLPLDILPAAMVILSGFVGLQTVYDSILGEKKAKTLEMLLSTRLPSHAIVIGKATPGAVFGCALSVLSYVLFVVLPFVTQVSIESPLTPLVLLFALPISYLASCGCIMTTLLIPDEKASPLIALAAMLLLLYGGWKMSQVLLPRFGTDATITTIAVLLVLLCIASTMLAAGLLRKVHLFTKP